ncbi:hypothetical protein K457DRAFT_289265 [Linnemannia elongata AG-77]|uniref:Ndc10 domain-containing protein n=1 Tax=Linnemannia elongata AG-77 TaxID=1314771 RepID=A0A197K4Q3_9FUNG|nr:hypothetical protein K457DRAFT_289265 [Linnemannia elongata AG-77]
MQDGLAERGDDGGGDRRKAVLPFFAKGKKRRTDGTYSMTVPALQTVKAYVCSIVDLCRTQQLIGMKDMLQQPHPRSTVYRTMIAKYQERIAGDPLAEAKKYATIGPADGRELQNIQDLMRAAWKNRYNLSGIPTKNQPQKITGVRLRLLASWGHFMMMRGENLRYAKLPHVNLHSFANLSGGKLHRAPLPSS